MYLYKYLFKGPDQARYSIVSGESITEPDGQGVQNEHNEFRDYVQARYLSSSEAVWRIFAYDITNKTPWPSGSVMLSPDTIE